MFDCNTDSEDTLGAFKKRSIDYIDIVKQLIKEEFFELTVEIELEAIMERLIKVVDYL